MARLKGDLHEEEHKQKSVFDLFQRSYQNWISFGQQDHLLLDENKIALVLQFLVQPTLSIDLMEYLFCSISLFIEDEEIETNKLKEWLQKLGADGVADLYERLFRHPTPKLRQGAIILALRLEEPHAVENMVKWMKHEIELDVKRVFLRSMYKYGKRLPEKLAKFFLDSEKDWMIQSYALANLVGHRSCLLVSDGTDFATDLGMLAQKVGFRLVTFPGPDFPSDLEVLEDEIFRTYELLIVVRGEHFVQMGGRDFHSKLKRFVSGGGSLFTTSWMNWETKYDDDFTEMLPFTHIRDSYNENRLVLCQPLENALSKQLFPEPISYCTSFELLEQEKGSIVLLETNDGIPIFGYRGFGSGYCYYLNTCQHFCGVGWMASPLRSSPKLNECLQRVFEWIYKLSGKRK